VKQTLDFEWIVEGEMRPIPTLASKVKLLVEDKLGSLAGQVCMQLCMESTSPAQGSQ
jgi:hypothetical protein